MKYPLSLLLIAACLLGSTLATERIAAQETASSQPTASTSVVFGEKDGLLAVEAEHFFQQTQSDKRAFYHVTADNSPNIQPDGDPSHVGGASGGSYLEILPDTRRTHDDELIRGTNFAPEAGKMAVLSYKINIKNAGRYYFWVRAFSTGSEDNGLHVGIDGQWPDSGQRLQWCQGKQSWRWESKQRTDKQHCGEAHKIFIDIDEGPHTISFSMREDGFEFDKWLMTNDRDFKRPEDAGPASVVHSGTAPTAFAFVKAMPKPANTTQKKPSHNAQAAKQNNQSYRLPAKSFTLNDTGFYLDKGKWAAVNPDQNKQGKVAKTLPLPTGNYNITLEAVGENDGRSTYQIHMDDSSVCLLYTSDAADE